MELPGIGNNCAEKSCKQLDFLPMKCDACQNIFCKDHIMYDGHSCPESYRKDNQVPVCPLCNKLIPVKPGSTPDIEVGRHIDADCQSDPAKERRGKVFTNKCDLKGCKAKELVPMVCEKCQRNFCVRHRHELDHNCKGFEGSGNQGTRAGAAAAARATVANGVSNKAPQQTALSGFGRDLDRSRQQRQQQQQNRVSSGAIQHLQGTLSEDEAMAQALAMSMSDSKASNSSDLSPDEVLLKQQQEEADFALAQALAQSEQNTRRPAQRQTSDSKDRCVMS